ncbi:MAG: ABC transporter permease [Candidatus Marinimicrobia bacterium]|nr:ABC transporter permease [Candidatus Neomarinimicrobiota bacterium]
MNNSWRLAGRLLMWRQDSRRLNWSALLSAAGIAIGTAVLILSLSVLNGFQTDVEESLHRFEGHGVLWPLVGQPDLEATRELLRQAGIASQPYAQRKLVLQSGDDYRLVTARIVPNLDSLRRRLGPAVLTPVPYPGNGEKVLVGSLLASKLSLYPGDRVRLLSPLDISLSSLAPPEVEGIIESIFEVGLLDFDESYLFINFATARRLMPRIDQMSSLALTAEPPPGKIESILAMDEWQLTTWRTEHRELIAAMELEKIGSAIVLFLIILVASFNATSTMVMTVMEKVRQIGILRSLGASKKYVVGLFLRQGLLVGLVGVAIGTVTGVGIAWLQMATGMIPGPGRAYLDGLPMRLQAADVALVISGTLLLTLISAWYPARYAAGIQPGQAVNYLK